MEFTKSNTNVILNNEKLNPLFVLSKSSFNKRQNDTTNIGNVNTKHLEVKDDTLINKSDTDKSNHSSKLTTLVVE